VTHADAALTLKHRCDWLGQWPRRIGRRPTRLRCSTCRDPRPARGPPATPREARPRWKTAAHARILARRAPRRRWCARSCTPGGRGDWAPQIAGRSGLAASTVQAVLVRYRLSHVDRATGEPIRRYEHHPGSLIHVDVKKLGNIPDAAAGATSVAPTATGTAPGHPVSPATSTTTPRWGRRSCTQ
jgi:hypothetical protein